jgi:hypothetical protein
MAFAGLRGTGDWATDERPKSFREMILWFNPNGEAPLTALLAKARKQAVDDSEFSWYEETQGINRVTINYGTGYAAGDETFVIDSGGLGLVAGDTLMVEKTFTTTYDPEIVLVSSVTSDTVIVVKRAQSGSSAGSIADNAALLKTGSAFGEGSSAPDVSLRNPTKYYNYTQIFRTTLEETRTAKQTRTRTGDAWTNDKKRKAFDHSIALEQAMLFGRKYETTGANGKPLRFTGGVLSFISTHFTMFTTTPTEDTLLAALYPVFDYSGEGSGDERIILCGNGFLNSLNKLARNSSSTRINFAEKLEKVYGMNLHRWTIPQGTFLTRTHPLFNQHPVFTYSGVVLNFAGLLYRPLNDTKFEDDIQDKGKDSKKAGWITEAGLELHHEKTMAYVGNFVV